MNIIRRWSRGIVSRIDWVVTQVENQEALVDSSLRELREKTAQARVQYRRVLADGERLRQQRDESAAAEPRWRERAGRCGDDAQALECLRRARTAAQATAALSRREEEHRRVAQQLGRDVAEMEERLGVLQHKRNLMRARQTRAEALEQVAEGGVGGTAELEAVFDRWEARVVEAEYAGACGVVEEDLDRTLSRAEEEAELRLELARLRGEGAAPAAGRPS